MIKPIENILDWWDDYKEFLIMISVVFAGILIIVGVVYLLAATMPTCVRWSYNGEKSEFCFEK